MTHTPSPAPTMSPTLERETLILEASFKVFTRYGFTRSTMDDIAREAGISRPALYLLFRNKKDIYRAFAERMTRQMTDGLESQLKAEGTAQDVLTRAFQVSVIIPMHMFAGTEHGHELLDMKSSLAADIMEAMYVREQQILTAFFVRHGKDSQTAYRIADLMIDALEGAKSRMRDVDGFEVKLQSIIGLVVKL